MAKGRYITDFEKMVIRVGVANGHSDADIARFMNRSRPLVTVWRTKMEKDGSIADLPFGFVADDVAGELAKK
ncbi:MAG: helix-turn-helix domain-containing protein [Roseicyclus sp.]|nr:helix-turn-helix domain-containing protein [Roseicyclus sp.]MBO6922371.1 helix-turn-helix domain-containing protein [Roseicyclus sp.]